ncbi:MAG: secreted protein [Nocardioides sp.]|nr:secreted protein [Nocardioides sp.]
MSKHAKHTPQHRNAPVRAISTDAPRRAIRTTVLLSGVAMAATGAAVSTGVMTQSAGVSDGARDVGDTLVPVAGKPANRAELAARTASVSRSDRRDAADPTKEAALSSAEGRAMTRTENLSAADPRVIAQALLPEFGYSQDQFSCLDSLWTRESGWRVNADNPSSTAYGIPQALPGSKMSSAGADWATNPVTQIRWGLGYIKDRYGSPCSAWSHSQSYNFY